MPASLVPPVPSLCPQSPSPLAVVRPHCVSVSLPLFIPLLPVPSGDFTTGGPCPCSL